MRADNFFISTVLEPKMMILIYFGENQWIILREIGRGRSNEGQVYYQMK
jgi:hypothetical protein